VTGTGQLLQRQAPDRARGSAAAAAKTCPDSGFVVGISSPAGDRAVFFSCAARTRAGLEIPQVAT